ncbi:MarR family transcriptional regulator [Belnapia rosea]|uniref:MarR family transcriptional regulator, transcriptional regulator for hemolysin n=1 Tax=Belnapia rosea TaxID=938405 RepID=A0A1G6NKQ5_9PROT|nr:MarR family transcriptional regulator [Belnapia rosea]SDB66565.1 MarR family transcriptional regulator, transcriptional regulator for hemolysin [Belnapia rosea]SDC68582.1 MarR family transcriptional regulator, transcriptional regulator for hemolysin [Belnapia rosea]
MRDGSTLAHTQWRLGLTIAQIARRWRGRLDARIADFGLTEARWLALLTLSRYGDGLTQKDLANRLLIEGPTLVRTLDWLEGEGLVERRSSAQDRRAKTLHLTERAGPLIQRIEAAATIVRAEILADIPEDDLAACLAVLERVATGLATPPAGG